MEKRNSLRTYPKALSLLFFFTLFQSDFVLGQHEKRFFRMPDRATSVKIPFKLVNNLIIVSGLLNGKFPVNVVLDTGCPSNLLVDPAITRKLNQKGASMATFSGPGTGKRKVKGKVFTEMSLDVANLQGRNLSMVATKTKPAFLKEIKQPVHAILGYPFFYQFVVQVDFGKSLLTITEYNDFLPPIDAIPFPFSISTAKPVLTTTISFGPEPFIAKLLIDTGAYFNLMFYGSLSAQTKPFLKRRVRGVIGQGFGGTIYGMKGIFSNFNINNFNFKRADALLLTQNQYHKTDHPQMNGSIGNGLLKDFVVTFDYAREVMYLQQPGPNQQIVFGQNETDLPHLSAFKRE